jgi:uncharacterized OsmC-like protein
MSYREIIRQKVEGKLKAIRSNPKMAGATIRVATRLEEGLRCSAKARNLPPIAIDEPRSIGGTDKGMNPIELLLSAMGTCQEIMYAVHAAILDIRLDELRVNCVGKMDLRGLFNIDNTVTPGLTSLEYETHISSPASAEQIITLMKLAERSCPVMDTLVRPVHATGRVYLNGVEISTPQLFSGTVQGEI